MDSVERVAKRAEIGKLFFTFREDTPPFLLGDKIDQLKRTVPIRQPVVQAARMRLSVALGRGQKATRVPFGVFEPTYQNRTASIGGCYELAVRR